MPLSPAQARVARSVLCTLLAFSLWMPAIHLVFPAGPLDARSPRAQALLAHELELHASPDRRARATLGLRAGNPEWDLEERLFFVLALSSLSLQEPEERGRYLAAVDQVIDETRALDSSLGPSHFLLPYGAPSPGEARPRPSLFVEGEIALMMAARLRALPDERLAGELGERIARLSRAIGESPRLLVESYPDECWMVDHAAALAAVRLWDLERGEDHGALFRAFIAGARAGLTDPATGLLGASFTRAGRPLEGPEGSSLWLSLHFLSAIDPPFASEQYELGKRLLTADVLGFRVAREWPAGKPARADIDSGPTIPLVEASAGSSGLLIVAAGGFGDRETLSGLLSSVDLAAFPRRRGKGLSYAAASAVGDAAILYALSAGPLFTMTLAGGRS